jgi:hypothetical protein
MSQTDTLHSKTDATDAAPIDHDNPPAVAELFNHQERAQFDLDDVAAGRAIGKMLGLFFLYTVIVMSAVAWWTYNSGLP